MAEVFFGDLDGAVDGTVGVTQGMGEEPVVGLGDVEVTGRGAVVFAFEPVVAETAVNMVLLHSLNDALRFFDADGAVGCAVDYPEGEFAEGVEVLHGGTAAECHRCCDFLRIAAGEVEGAITSETHSEHIDAIAVEGVVLFHPFEDVVYLHGTPGSTHVMGCDDDGMYLESVFRGVDGSVFQCTVHAASAEACAVEEDDEWSVLFGLVVVFGQLYPEAVAFGLDAAVRFQTDFLCRHVEGKEHRADIYNNV